MRIKSKEKRQRYLIHNFSVNLIKFKLKSQINNSILLCSIFSCHIETLYMQPQTTFQAVLSLISFFSFYSFLFFILLACYLLWFNYAVIYPIHSRVFELYIGYIKSILSGRKWLNSRHIHCCAAPLSKRGSNSRRLCHCLCFFPFPFLLAIVLPHLSLSLSLLLCLFPRLLVAFLCRANGA